MLDKLDGLTPPPGGARLAVIESGRVAGDDEEFDPLDGDDDEFDPADDEDFDEDWENG